MKHIFQVLVFQIKIYILAIKMPLLLYVILD